MLTARHRRDDRGHTSPQTRTGATTATDSRRARLRTVPRPATATGAQSARSAPGAAPNGYRHHQWCFSRTLPFLIPPVLRLAVADCAHCAPHVRGAVTTEFGAIQKTHCATAPTAPYRHCLWRSAPIGARGLGLAAGSPLRLTVPSMATGAVTVLPTVDRVSPFGRVSALERSQRLDGPRAHL